MGIDYTQVKILKFQLVDETLSPLPGIPPLFQFVNPTELSFQWRKILNTYKTRGARIIEHYGDQLTTVTASNVTGGFIEEPFVEQEQNKKFDTVGGFIEAAKNVNPTPGGGGYISKVKTGVGQNPNNFPRTWKNFAQILALYRNSGHKYFNNDAKRGVAGLIELFSDDFFESTTQDAKGFKQAFGEITEYGFVIIQYDYAILAGYFNSFNYTKSAQNPYMYEFNWDFTVVEEILSLSRGF